MLEKGSIQIYYGEGRGKTNAALGNALRAAGEGKTVVIVQFLKGKNGDSMEFLQRLEPEARFSVLKNRKAIMTSFRMRKRMRKR